MKNKQTNQANGGEFYNLCMGYINRNRDGGSSVIAVLHLAVTIGRS